MEKRFPLRLLFDRILCRPIRAHTSHVRISLEACNSVRRPDVELVSVCHSIVVIAISFRYLACGALTLVDGLAVWFTECIDSHLVAMCLLRRARAHVRTTQTHFAYCAEMQMHISLMERTRLLVPHAYQYRRTTDGHTVASI